MNNAPNPNAVNEPSMVRGSGTSWALGELIPEVKVSKAPCSSGMVSSLSKTAAKLAVLLLSTKELAENDRPTSSN